MAHIELQVVRYRHMNEQVVVKRKNIAILWFMEHAVLWGSLAQHQLCQCWRFNSHWAICVRHWKYEAIRLIIFASNLQCMACTVLSRAWRFRRSRYCNSSSLNICSTVALVVAIAVLCYSLVNMFYTHIISQIAQE